MNGNIAKFILLPFKNYHLYLLKTIIMNRENMAERYSQLLNEHTILFNQISAIKAENLELTQSQINEVRRFEHRQNQIESEIKQMMSHL